MEEYKLFIKKAAILLILFVILFLITNQLYMDFILKEKILYKDKEQFIRYKEDNDLKILIFGDSLPVHDVNPMYINNSFNLATPGESLEQTYYKVKWAIENEPEVEVFILEYNYHLFNYDRIKPYYDTWYWKYFMSYQELSKVTNDSKINLFFIIEFPVIGKGDEIYQFYKKNETTVLLDGWINDTTIFPEDRKNTFYVGKTRAYNQFKNYPIVRDEKLVQIFLDTLALLNENNKTIILVQYPLTDEYLTPLEREVNISAEYQDVKDKILGYGIILNYREMFRYNQTLFIDSDHLNEKGSAIFSKMLFNDI